MKRDATTALLSAGARLLLSGTQGAALATVLAFVLLITIATVGIVALVQADLTAGIRQLQAVRVFNVGEAGVHYAIATMQTAGADTYDGETRTVMDGATPIGTAVVQVRCLDGSLPSVNACAGPHVGLRRITSTGTLPVSGPRRVVTVVVEGTTSLTSTFALCAYNGLSLDQDVTVYGSVGSNGNISLSGPANANRAAICDSSAGGLGGRCGTPNPAPVSPFAASAFAEGTITCSGGGCANQVEGTVAPNQPAGSVCPVVTLTPPAPPGTTPLNVPRGSTTFVDPSVNYGTVTLDDTPGNPNPCPANPAQRATLVIDSGADPNTTVTVRMATLTLGVCSRLEVRGVGRVELWLLTPASLALDARQKSIFGTKSSVVGSEEAIEGSRLTVNVVSTNATAAHFDQTGLVAGTFVLPSGGFDLDQAQLTNGAVLANTIHFDRSSTYTWDPRSSIGAATYTNFNRLRSWKDQ